MLSREQVLIGTFAAIAAALILAGILLMPVDNENNIDNNRFDNSTLPEKTGNITIPEKPWNITIIEKRSQVPVSPPESRFVWAADAGANKTFILTPLNFDGFYYDLDNNAGSESLSITLANPGNRTIHENDLKYSTTASNIPFKYRPFGNYSMIGFMGEKYLAGYDSDSRIANSPINLLEHGLLSKILIDEKMDHKINPGRALILKEDYTIWIENVDIAEGTAIISLKKKDEEIDRMSIREGDEYIYRKKIRRMADSDLHDNISIGNFPIIAIHIDSIQSEKIFPVVSIKGIFQLSDIYTKIETEPDFWIFGNMKIADITKTGVSFTNGNSLYLRYPYSKEYELNSLGIMKNFGFHVADSRILRFFAEKESQDYDIYERRGAVFTESNPVMAWDGLNFAGFLYDPDSGSYSQKLEIINISGRKIPSHDLKYTAFTMEMPFTVTKKTGIKPPGTNGSFKAIGLGTDTYAVIKGKNINLAKIIIANGTQAHEKKHLYNGDKWELDENYSLEIRLVDTRPTPRTAVLALKRNGIELYRKSVSSGSIFSLMNDNLSKQEDPPIFMTYLETVFNGEVMPDLIELRYTWQVSDTIMEVKEGDRFGVFSVKKIGSNSIELDNDMAINLDPGSCINLFGDLAFVVADSDELRFYPTNDGGNTYDAGRGYYE